MAGESFRFIHASDLRLDQPLYGFTEVPDHLRDLALDAPFHAAERIMELAIVERVDFVVLSGDVVDPRTCGPRALAFLFEQFTRLGERGIQVYWAGGDVDSPANWPDEIALPENVRMFASNDVQTFQHNRGDRPLASLVGRSGSGRVKASDFEADTSELCCIAVAHGTADVGELSKHRIDYWALGGDTRHQVLATSPVAVEYSGSPQGRCPSESGIHGCLVVDVDADGDVHTQFVATDVIRWRYERLTLGQGLTGQDLKRILRDRMKNVALEANDRPLLISWSIDGQSENLADQQRLSRDLLTWLRDEFGQGTATAWTISLRIEPTSTFPPEWYEEDTILGDFLRVVRDYERDSSRTLGLAAPYAEHPELASLVTDVQIADPKVRAEVLREAAIMGSELLRGDENALHDDLLATLSSEKQEVLS